MWVFFKLSQIVERLTPGQKQGIDDALIQPYSGHDSRQSLEVYSRLSIKDAQKEYNENIGKFPI